jgi:hypothetical protein
MVATTMATLAVCTSCSRSTNKWGETAALKTGCCDLAPNPVGYLVTERGKFKVRTKLPAVALTTTVAEPSVAVEVAENLKAVLPLPGAGS